MSTEEKVQRTGESPISFAVSELRRAAVEKERLASAAPSAPLREKRGFDPYNTAADFDRGKIWSRVDKR